MTSVFYSVSVIFFDTRMPAGEHTITQRLRACAINFGAERLDSGVAFSRDTGTHTRQGVIKPLFCVLEDELLSASDELLRETGQPYHVVGSHNELKVPRLRLRSPRAPKWIKGTFCTKFTLSLRKAL